MSPEKMNVLLIWNQFDDDLVLYEFPAGSPMAKLALASHGQYVNSVDTPDDAPVHELSDKLPEHEGAKRSMPAIFHDCCLVEAGFIP